MSSRPFLTKPDARYRQSYLAMVAEIRRAGEPFIPFVLGLPTDNFDELLASFENFAAGLGLPEGFVPHSTYWLIDNDEVVGVSNLRHSLSDWLRVEGGHIGYGVRPSRRGQGYGTLLLSLTLEKAKLLEFDRALITCGKTNEASRRVIIANGGRLDSEQFVDRRGEIIQRYWISL